MTCVAIEATLAVVLVAFVTPEVVFRVTLVTHVSIEAALIAIEAAHVEIGVTFVAIGVAMHRPIAPFIQSRLTILLVPE